MKQPLGFKLVKRDRKLADRDPAENGTQALHVIFVAKTIVPRPLNTEPEDLFGYWT